MTEKYVVYVSNKNMLSIFSGADIIHPYRFQPYVSFIITFSEYKEFVSSMLERNVSWLKFDVSKYKEALEMRNDKLLTKLYLFDISKAIISELVMAVSYQEEATIILHDFDETLLDTISLHNVSDMVTSIPAVILQKALDSLKRDIKLQVSFSNLTEHNKAILHYALLLRSWCSSLDCRNIKMTKEEI